MQTIELNGIKLRSPKARAVDVVAKEEKRLEKLIKDNNAERADYVSEYRACAENLVKQCLVDESQMDALNELFEDDYYFAFKAYEQLLQMIKTSRDVEFSALKA